MKYKKYDILEISWLDSHSRSGWTDPREVKAWIERANNNFIVKTIGYFFHEDDKFLRVCQSHDSQGQDKDGSGDDNKDALFAIAKSCIQDIKVLK